jgi:hypothetical protein
VLRCVCWLEGGGGRVCRPGCAGRDGSLGVCWACGEGQSAGVGGCAMRVRLGQGGGGVVCHKGPRVHAVSQQRVSASVQAPVATAPCSARLRVCSAKVLLRGGCVRGGRVCTEWCATAGSHCNRHWCAAGNTHAASSMFIHNLCAPPAWRCSRVTCDPCCSRASVVQAQQPHIVPPSGSPTHGGWPPPVNSPSTSPSPRHPPSRILVAWLSSQVRLCAPCWGS